MLLDIIQIYKNEAQILNLRFSFFLLLYIKGLEYNIFSLIIIPLIMYVHILCHFSFI